MYFYYSLNYKIEPLTIFFEILQTILPALVVFLAVYLVIKKFFDAQLTLEQLKLRKQQLQTRTEVKLQAYERLSLFCERISIPNLVMRLNAHEMTPDALYKSMLISIQKEYEHNLVQQIYVSDQLWEIIKLAKDQTIAMIDHEKESNGSSGTQENFVNRLMQISNLPIHTALAGIKKETQLMF